MRACGLSIASIDTERAGLYEETYAQHSMCERSTYQGIFMPPYTAVQVRKIAVEYKEKANKSLPTFILK